MPLIPLHNQDYAVEMSEADGLTCNGRAVISSAVGDVGQRPMGEGRVSVGHGTRQRG